MPAGILPPSAKPQTILRVETCGWKLVRRNCRFMMRTAMLRATLRALLGALCFSALSARAQIDWHALDPWRGWTPPPEQRRPPPVTQNYHPQTPRAAPVKTPEQIARENALKYLVDANAALGRGDLQGAIDQLIAAIRWTPDDPSILRLLEDARAELAAKEKAEAEARRRAKLHEAVVSTLPPLITTLQIAPNPEGYDGGAGAPGFPIAGGGGSPPGFTAAELAAASGRSGLPPGFRGPDSINVPPPSSPSAYSCPVASFDSVGAFEIVAKNGHHYSSSDLAVVPLDGGTRVITRNNSRVRFLLPDDTIFTLGPNSDMVLDDFVYDPKTDTRTILARMAKGAFRWVTGKVEPERKLGPESPPARNMNLRLPVGSLGIRGTDFLTAIRPDGTTIVWLFSGEVDFANAKTLHPVKLHAGQMLTIRPDGTCAPLEPFTR
jgi:hypothetical protein